MKSKGYTCMLSETFVSYRFKLQSRHLEMITEQYCCCLWVNDTIFFFPGLYLVKHKANNDYIFSIMNMVVIYKFTQKKCWVVSTHVWVKYALKKTQRFIV